MKALGRKDLLKLPGDNAASQRHGEEAPLQCGGEGGLGGPWWTTACSLSSSPPPPQNSPD